MDKSSLSSVIKEEGVGGENDSETGESSSSSAALEQLSSNLTVAGLKALILPDCCDEEENSSGCECVSVDPALQTFVKNSGTLKVTVSKIE